MPSKKNDNEKKAITDEAKEIYENGKKHASEFYNESKKNVNSIVEDLGSMSESVKDSAADLYEEGKKCMHHAEAYLCKSSDELAKRIKEKPLSAVLIASGLGWLLASLLRK